MNPALWNAFIGELDKADDKNPVFISILRGVQPVSDDGQTLCLHCESSGQKGYLEKRKSELETLYEKHMGEKKKLTFLLDIKTLQKTQNAPLLDFTPSQEDILKKCGVSPLYSFQNFAVSNTNQVAFAAAQSVAQTPGTSYNPLFFYGGVGVGKTHLAHSVARTLLEKNGSAHVFCCSGERFMNDLIESIREKNTIKFRKKYRNLQLIVIDDIQFIAGKQTVQEEFFHTFNSIVSAGGQVILTSDRHPQEIQNLEDRLRSRFSGGLIVDIQNPDFELRTAIVMIKAKERKIEIDIDAAKAIAEIATDARSLEGTLISYYAKSLNSGSQINIEFIDSQRSSQQSIQKKRIEPTDVLRAICIYYNVKSSHIRGSSRKSDIAHARQVCMYILRTSLSLHLDEIAKYTKRKDHTTVIHAVNKIQREMVKNERFKDEIDTIIKSINLST